MLNKTQLLLVSAGFIAAIAGCNSANQHEQAKLLNDWANDSSLSVNDIVAKAADFDKNMNPHEGIGCIRSTAMGYQMLVHPNPGQVADKMVSDQMRAAIQGKTRPDHAMVSYTLNNMEKEAVVYPITDDTFCAAFWLKSK